MKMRRLAVRCLTSVMMVILFTSVPVFDTRADLCWDVRVQDHVECGWNPPDSGSGQQDTPTSAPAYDWQAEQQRKAELERQRREREEAERRHRAEAEKQRFIQDKQEALNQLKGLAEDSPDRKENPLTLKSGTATLGLKGSPNPVSELKEIGTGDSDPKPGGVKSDTEQLATVDPAMIQEKTLTETDWMNLRRTFKMKEVPSPSGYRSKSERHALAAALSDAQLENALRETRRQLERLKQDLQKDSNAMDDLLKEAEQAELDALLAGFNLLTAGAVDKFPTSIPDKPQYNEMLRHLKFLTKRAAGVPGIKSGYDEDKKNDNNKQLVATLVTEGYAILVEYGDVYLGDFAKKLLDAGLQYISLASFALSYGEAALRWGVTRNQMQILIDNIDAPNGKLKAAESLGRLYQDLIDEKKQRKQNT